MAIFLGKPALFQPDGTVDGTAPFETADGPIFVEETDSQTLFDGHLFFNQRSGITRLDISTGERDLLPRTFQQIVEVVDNQMDFLARSETDFHLAKMPSATAEPQHFFSLQISQTIDDGGGAKMALCCLES